MGAGAPGSGLCLAVWLAWLALAFPRQERTGDCLRWLWLCLLRRFALPAVAASAPFCRHRARVRLVGTCPIQCTCRGLSARALPIYACKRGPKAALGAPDCSDLAPGPGGVAMSTDWLESEPDWGEDAKVSK